MEKKKQAWRAFIVGLIFVLLTVAAALLVFVDLGEALRLVCISESRYLLPVDGLVGVFDMWFFGWFENYSPTHILGFSLFALVAVISIVMVVVMCVKRKGKVAAYGIASIVMMFALLFAASIVLEINTVSGYYFDTYLIDALTFSAVGDVIVDVFDSVKVLVFAVLALVAVICVIALEIVLMIEPKAVREPKAVKEEPKPVEPSAEVKDEGVEEVKEEPKRKVILTVKRFDIYANSNNIVEKETNYPKENIEVKALSTEDIRAVLRDELERRELASRALDPYRYEERRCEQKRVNNEPDCCCVDAKKEEEVKEVPTPVIVTIPTPIKKEEEKPVEKEKKGLTKEDVQNIIKEELAAALEEFKKEAKLAPKKEPRTIVVRVPRQVVTQTVVQKEVVKEEAKAEPAPAPVAEPVKEEKPASAPKAEPVKEEVKAEPAPAPVASEEAPAEEGVAKVERVPFSTRMKEAAPELRDHYNNLKSLLKSYGLNNRVANGGDTFRLHRVTYCKITIAGKALKLYLALDPNDYKDTTLPIKDSSGKAVYKDIPLVFKVKSDLSYRRAEQLITDCMEKHGLEQIDQVKVEDWASRLDEEMAAGDDSED